MKARIGQVLGEYRLSRQLGQGAFADVFLGEHILIKKKAAIKVLHTSLINQEDNFINEARIIASLAHDHIIRIHNFAIDKHGPQPIPYLVMDYAPQGSILQRHASGQRLTYQQIILYVEQIASALDYAHTQKLIHRDVKPANILIGQDNKLLLSDFGIAVILQQTSEESDVPAAGTKAYIAPEQILGKPVPQSDQYALGIIVYEWLCGHPPFPVKGNSTDAILFAHLKLEPPPLRSRGLDISSKTDYVMKRVLEKDPNRRFATVTEFAQQLRSAFEETARVVVLPPPPHEPVPSPNAPTIAEISPKNVTVKQSNAGQASADRTRQGILQPPEPPTARLRQQPGKRKPNKGGSRSPRALDWRYLFAPKWAAFRVTSVLLLISSALLVSLDFQNIYPGILCLLVALPLFGLCMLLPDRRVTFLFAFLLACYWAIVGGVLDVTTVHLPKFASMSILGILAFCISLVLYVWYALTKSP